MRESLQIVKNYIDANELLEMGFTLVRFDKSLEDRNKIVCFFKKEEGLMDALKRISESYKNKK